MFDNFVSFSLFDAGQNAKINIVDILKPADEIDVEPQTVPEPTPQPAREFSVTILV